MYKFIKMQYRLRAITEAQAQKITGKPRPAQETKQETQEV